MIGKLRQEKFVSTHATSNFSYEDPIERVDGNIYYFWSHNYNKFNILSQFEKHQTKIWIPWLDFGLFD